MTAQDEPTQLEQLGSDILHEVEFFMRDYGANVSLLEYVPEKQEKYFPTLLAKVQKSNPDWTKEQVVAAWACHLLSGEELLWCGIAKRAINDDLAELARFVSL